MKYRVLHVLDKLVPGSGVSSVVMSYVREVHGVLQDIAVYGEVDAALEQMVTEQGGTVFRLSDVRLRFGQSFLRDFSELIREYRYHIIHGHLLNSAFLYLAEARRQNVPHRIIHAHNTVNSDGGIPKRLRNSVLMSGLPHWANHYAACSKAAARMFKSRAGETEVLYNGINTERFKYNGPVRKEIREELGIGNDDLCLGAVARFSPQKNDRFLLDIFSEILKHRKCVLVRIGSGELEAEMKERSGELGIYDKICFLGTRTDTERFYQAFDVFVMPSLFEGFGIAAVEAQCAGLPCVLSDRVPDEVACADNICFLPLGSAEQWVKTIIEYSDRERKDGSMAVSAAGVDIKSTGKRLTEYYRKICETD